MAADARPGLGFADTNVLVYAFDASEPAKRARALELLAAEDVDLVVSAQVLNEFYWVATRKLNPPLAPDVAHEVVRELSLGRVVPVDADLVDRAIELSRSTGLALWDAGVVVAAQMAGCGVLRSEDLNAGQRFDGVVVRDPFAP
ncbi:MAG: PIN domain-containing protein [Trueperaceae bacterium]|nr:PIN domain-containing protein [Trueperaceae bacterium]